MPTAIHKLLLVLALAGAVAVGGCGTSKEDKNQVRRTVKGLYAALAARDSGRFCKSLTTDLRKEVSRRASPRGQGAQSCERVLGYLLNFARNLDFAKRARVVDVSIDGDKATAIVQQPGKDGGIQLAKERGAWKVSNFSLKKL
jgi:ketosteroid isomerase-like protein